MKKLLLFHAMLLCSVSLSTIDPFDANHNQNKKIIQPIQQLSLDQIKINQTELDQKLKVAAALTRQPAKLLLQPQEKGHNIISDELPSSIKNLLIAIELQKDEKNKLDEIDNTIKK